MIHQQKTEIRQQKYLGHRTLRIVKFTQSYSNGHLPYHVHFITQRVLMHDVASEFACAVRMRRNNQRERPVKFSIMTQEKMKLFSLNIVISFSWFIDATAHRVDSRRMTLFPASCSRCLRVFRADLKQPPEPNDPEEGRGQSPVLPVTIKRRKEFNTSAG